MGSNGSNDPFPANDLPFARSYQLEALEKAIKQNTIVFLETGSGKTLIAIMLLRRHAHFLRKPSPFIAVFLVPKVVLVKQQAEAVEMHTDLKVGRYWGEMGVDFWDAATWKQQQDKYEVLVMTPAILLDALRHSFLRLDNIKVLIFDECHNARGKHPYACIMMEFYHQQLRANGSQLPRILGLTASPVKKKGSSSGTTYWKDIKELETLMNSKVYTCASESVLAEYIPFSDTKFKFYQNRETPNGRLEWLIKDLTILREKRESSIRKSDLSESSKESAKRRLSKLYSSLHFCLSELGVWLASKAAETFSCEGNDLFSWETLDVCGEAIVKSFSRDAHKLFSSRIPTGWSIDDNDANLSNGYLSAKVLCLIESLVEYRNLKDLRCIIFVERVITAIVLKSLLTVLKPKLYGWRTEYVAGNHSTHQSQSRVVQNKIVNEFHTGMVNIVVATSILEEGLDVPSCNVVIRFDLSATVCSFIQSRGRARKQNSDFLLMVESGDNETLNKVHNYLASSSVMRKDSLSHASQPCEALDSEVFDHVFYQVESTGAILTLNSSINLIYFYCSRLPSDCYFKPYPRCIVDKEEGVCSIYFPKSCPLPSVHVSGNIKVLKQIACAEACKQLHLMGALTDNLVPDIVKEETDAQQIEYEYTEEQVRYFPPELVSKCGSDSAKLHHFYLIKLQRSFDYDVPLQDIVLAVSTKLDIDDKDVSFDLEVDKGNVTVNMTYVGDCILTSEQVHLSQFFQMMVLRVLLDHKFLKLQEAIDAIQSRDDQAVFHYLLLPSNGKSTIIDWESVQSVLFSLGKVVKDHVICSPIGYNHQQVHTLNGLVCSCLLANSLVYTPHSGRLYCTTNPLHGLNGNSTLTLKSGEVVTYKSYYKTRHGVELRFEEELLFAGRQIFPVRNLLHQGRQHKEKESSNANVELPPELCLIVMSPIPISTFYSFSFVPSIMHRIESLLTAFNLKKMHSDYGHPTSDIPTLKVLEAITTKKCQERFHLESLETLGDSFLKYAASQHLFKVHQNQHEGILSFRRERIIANVSLCKVGCDRNLPGFIRNESFDPKMWIIPGDYASSFHLVEKILPIKRKVYCGGKRMIKKKVVADVVEALIGAYLSCGGEGAALSFMNWLGIKVDFFNTPYQRTFTVQPERLLNIRYLESLLNYTFHDPSLLVEALTHGSYMLPEIPRCYQRLEFLGDAVLDYLITVHLYHKHPGLSPGMLTDLRSASVNNECYAQSAVKVNLHKHILHASHELQRHIASTIHTFEQLPVVHTFGWESETAFPKVLGDIIESLAGAVFVDSGYNKDVVFQSIRPLLEPLITPDTLKLHPVRELHDVCQKLHFEIRKSSEKGIGGMVSFTIEVEADNIVYKDSSTAADKKTAEKLASRALLKSLKDNLSVTRTS